MKKVFDVNEWLRVAPRGYGDKYLHVKAHMADGYSVSIQAEWFSYCEPRESNAEHYYSVELGFPTSEDELINDYAEDDSDYTDTVYGYVPVDTVNQLIEKHGGIELSEESEEHKAPGPILVKTTLHASIEHILQAFNLGLEAEHLEWRGNDIHARRKWKVTIEEVVE